MYFFCYFFVELMVFPPKPVCVVLHVCVLWHPGVRPVTPHLRCPDTFHPLFWLFWLFWLVKLSRAWKEEEVQEKKEKLWNASESVTGACSKVSLFEIQIQNTSTGWNTNTKKYRQQEVKKASESLTGTCYKVSLFKIQIQNTSTRWNTNTKNTGN